MPHQEARGSPLIVDKRVLKRTVGFADCVGDGEQGEINPVVSGSGGRFGLRPQCFRLVMGDQSVDQVIDFTFHEKI